MINILISIGIFIFSIYPTMAKIQLFDASLVKPDSLEVLKNAQTSASTLKKLLDKIKNPRDIVTNFFTWKFVTISLGFFILSPIHLFLP